MFAVNMQGQQSNLDSLEIVNENCRKDLPDRDEPDVQHQYLAEDYIQSESPDRSGLGTTFHDEHSTLKKPKNVR